MRVGAGGRPGQARQSCSTGQHMCELGQVRLGQFTAHTDKSKSEDVVQTRLGWTVIPVHWRARLGPVYGMLYHLLANVELISAVTGYKLCQVGL